MLLQQTMLLHITAYRHFPHCLTGQFFNAYHGLPAKVSVVKYSDFLQANTQPTVSKYWKANA